MYCRGASAIFYKFYSVTKNTYQDTIYSLCSGFGKCGVSVVRVSGPSSLLAIKSIVNLNFKPKPRFAALKNLYHPKTGLLIDRGIVLWFPGPNSFTGEDSCEFQIHGSSAVIDSLYDALGSIDGLRLAFPGEYTKRAFFNGKLDLTMVDGLADLIHSETETQRKQALMQTTGTLSKLYKKWRQNIIKCIAYLEANIDFAEDEQIEDNVIENMLNQVKNLKNEIQVHLNDNREGELLRDGVKAIILGEPNVGKSSLMNLICQRQVSIVTPIAGTTRDIIETNFNIGGYMVKFLDTAGLRSYTSDIIESEGIARARDCLKNSDLVILIFDIRKYLEYVSFSKKNENNDINFKKEYLNSIGLEIEALKEKKIIYLGNKLDLLTTEEIHMIPEKIFFNMISCKNTKNIASFLGVLQGQLKEMCGTPTIENPRLTNTRYRKFLLECVENLENFAKSYEENEYPDLAIAAQKLRKSVYLIENITGDVTSEEILDVIFRDFCIGK